MTSTNKLYFSNPGEIDIRAVTTLGVNVKPGENPIGHFGTGVKYTIAGVLRLGGSITIWSGMQKYKFDAVSLDIRGKQFGIVHMYTTEPSPRPGVNPTEICVPLGFTTELGKDWEPWMLYRELKSNAVDEGGGLEWQHQEPTAGETLIEVDCKELWKADKDRHSFWLESTPLWSGRGLEVHDGRSPVLFYHNIRATNDKASKTADWAWVYNITDHQPLTEDRTLADFYSARTLIAKALAQCDNEEILERVLENEAEGQGFDFDHWDITASVEFVKVVLSRIERKLKVPASARDLVRRSQPDELEEAELDIPSDYEDMLRRAPPEAPEVKAYAYEWKNQTEERVEALELELRYWKACAKKLGGAP